MKRILEKNQSVKQVGVGVGPWSRRVSGRGPGANVCVCGRGPPEQMGLWMGPWAWPGADGLLESLGLRLLLYMSFLV